MRKLKKIQTLVVKPKTRRPAKRVRIKADEALSVREVELLRDLYENGFWGAEALAKKFGLTVHRVNALVKYKTHR